MAAVCGPRSKNDPGRSAGRSPWAGVGSASIGRGCVRATAVRCRWLPMSCSAAARSWVGWRWARCSVACRAAVTRRRLADEVRRHGYTVQSLRKAAETDAFLPAVAHPVGTPGQGQLARPQEPEAIAEGGLETCRVAAAKASLRSGPPGGPPTLAQARALGPRVVQQSRATTPGPRANVRSHVTRMLHDSLHASPSSTIRR